MRVLHGPLLRGRTIAVTAIVMAGVVLGGIAPAQAGSSILCSGYDDCAKKGYGHGGYRQARETSFWNMTPGTSCTNYVAYRLTHGRRTARPPGADAAATWGSAARAAGIKVVDTPRAGDVAWWAANVNPAKTKGHVAYVERVRADGSVIVSEDKMNGAFGWRRMTRSSAWPSGFIRFPASDGSPSGRVGEVKAADGKLDLWTTASDPDRFSAGLTYEVSLSGEDPAVEAERFSFTTPYFVTHRIKTVRTRGVTTVRIYARNLQGTAGRDPVLVGTKVVTIQ